MTNPYILTSSYSLESNLANVSYLELPNTPTFISFRPNIPAITKKEFKGSRPLSLPANFLRLKLTVIGIGYKINSETRQKEDNCSFMEKLNKSAQFFP